MNRKPLLERQINEIIELGRWHPPQHVAAKMGVTTRAVVKLLIGESLVPLREPRLRPACVAPAEPERPRFDAEQARLTRLAALMQERKPNPMEVAWTAWEGRLTDTGGCLKVNGCPVTYSELMRRTNRLLRGWGLPLLAANPAWLAA